ncbi:unnamed protein product [Urochloa humidicola]
MTTRTVRNHCTHGRVDTTIAWAVPARRNAPVQEKVFFSMVFACLCAMAVWPQKLLDVEAIGTFLGSVSCFVCITISTKYDWILECNGFFANQGFM